MSGFIVTTWEIIDLNRLKNNSTVSTVFSSNKDKICNVIGDIFENETLSPWSPEKPPIILSPISRFKTVPTFLPIKINLTFLLLFSNSLTLFLTSLLILLLNPPQSPLSAEIATIKTFLFWPLPNNNFEPFSLFTLDANVETMFLILVAYGLPDSALSCALFSLAEATIFMADVIFCVDLTVLILIFKSFKEGI